MVRKPRAFSMVELLIAMVIITALLIPLFGALMWGQQKTDLTVDQVIAENLAMRFLEYVHSFDFEEIDSGLENTDSLPDSLFVPVAGFDIEPLVPDDYEQVEFVPEGADPEDKVEMKYKIVTVKVTWEHLGDPKEIELADIFVSYK